MSTSLNEQKQAFLLRLVNYKLPPCPNRNSHRAQISLGAQANNRETIGQTSYWCSPRFGNGGPCVRSNEETKSALLSVMEQDRLRSALAKQFPTSSSQQSISDSAAASTSAVSLQSTASADTSASEAPLPHLSHSFIGNLPLSQKKTITVHIFISGSLKSYEHQASLSKGEFYLYGETELRQMLAFPISAYAYYDSFADRFIEIPTFSKIVVRASEPFLILRRANITDDDCADLGDLQHRLRTALRRSLQTPTSLKRKANTGITLTTNGKKSKF